MRLPKPDVHRIRTELEAVAAELSEEYHGLVSATVEPSELVPGVHARLSGLLFGRMVGITILIDHTTGRSPHLTQSICSTMAHRFRAHLNERRTCPPSESN